MFRSHVELEMLAEDRMNSMAAQEDHAAQLREAAAASGQVPAPRLTSRVKHGVGRGLIILGEHLAERPTTPPPASSHQLSSIRPH